jgi:outer membrane lipoprotein carrier protein
MKQVYLLLAGCALACGQDVGKITHGIEERYNNIKTLSVTFTQTRVDRAGRHLPESGTLYLRKPGRMRWEYTSPAGRFFLSDGEFTYDYDPKANRVEQRKLKDADDLRGPLAFLLGKLDFNRDFGEFRTGGADSAITAIPKSDNLPYSEVTFVATPEFIIKKLSIKGLDGSVTDYVFDGEKKNPPLSDSLFKFTKPAGAIVVDATHGN